MASLLAGSRRDRDLTDVQCLASKLSGTTRRVPVAVLEYIEGSGHSDMPRGRQREIIPLLAFPSS